jgi:hypothetical protein
MKTEDYGKSIPSLTIEEGLRDINSDLHFDLAARIGQGHPFHAERQGVWHLGDHICSMDRGSVPEFKIWSMAIKPVQVGFGEADAEDAAVKYKIISPFTPGYTDMYLAAARELDETLVVRNDGSLMKIHVTRPQQVKDRVIRVGWRHTFERLIMANIHNVTRQALAAKFNVDMFRWPTGSPIETMENIYAE